MSAASLERLMTHTFPGNVRELENLVEQAAALAEAEELTPDDFPLQAASEVGKTRGSKPEPGLVSLATAVSFAERVAIEHALQRFPEDLLKVASVLDVSATTLWRKMKRLGIAATSPSEDADTGEGR
jgi:two-component system response regulator HydG